MQACVFALSRPSWHLNDYLSPWTDMDGFKLLETIALELDVPVISKSLSPKKLLLSISFFS